MPQPHALSRPLDPPADRGHEQHRLQLIAFVISKKNSRLLFSVIPEGNLRLPLLEQVTGKCRKLMKLVILSHAKDLLFVSRTRSYQGVTPVVLPA